ncbi:hypothetical protein Desca_0983 [Desulfotomaculum nigrificans CO-1-SRB]|uniref:Uncharacterized protein n=1 Tax=Desulfotomaculum nigrificans (strain DSM 14880 / VKM B-2319 / CO-1-SRB) TaxID=868595 RepID=F6B2M8_DESCC|nr:YkyB family protein [Desulfotomaculum nigrificans]AEF93857.1 hypothetical protein Desca_0983 [Desulfotomaculum nigrificans CO-1-SRB]
MIQYRSWAEVPAYLKTKMKLEKLGLMPKYIDSPDAAIVVYDRHGYKRYYLYDIDRCIPIPNYTAPSADAENIEMTTENLAEALYVVNKFAKKMRDQKKYNYDAGQHDMVKQSRIKEQELYDLKEKVLSKMLAEERARILGIHKQTVENKQGELWENHLLLIAAGDYDFHRPARAKDIDKYPYLGEIDIIPADKKRATKLLFAESFKLLQKYLEN